MNITLLRNSKIHLRTVIVLVITLVLILNSTILALSVHAQGVTQSNELKAQTTKLTNEIDKRLKAVEQYGKSMESTNAISASTKTDVTKSLAEIKKKLTDYKSQIQKVTTVAEAKELATKLDSDYGQYATTGAKAVTLKDADSQQQSQGKLSEMTEQVQSVIDAGGAADMDMSAPQEQLKNIKQLIQSSGDIITSIIALITAMVAGDFTQAGVIFQSILGQLAQNLTTMLSAQNSLQGLADTLPTNLLTTGGSGLSTN